VTKPDVRNSSPDPDDKFSAPTELRELMDRIDILLATYNGAAFLGEQLASLEAQTHRNWRLLARDDGSDDGTPEILEAFRARHPDRVVVVRDGEGNLGVVANFSRLMELSDAPYAAFCDQDDVWVADKLELSLAKMRELERQHGADVPLLVFTDLTVVDEDLDVIHPSFWKYANLLPQRCGELNRLLLQNVVTGCATLMNRPLVTKSLPIPEQAVVHDWWVALVVVLFGKAGYISRPTVMYRQHARNVIGASTLSVFSLPVRVIRFVRKGDLNRKPVLTPFKQARAFLHRFSSVASTKYGDLVGIFLKIPRARLIPRFYYALKCRCLPVGVIRSAAFVVLCRGEY
jgi:glycosyltransferase involved in cell wall biosynthesis